MKCDECKGACCEEITLHVLVPDDETLEWVEARTASHSPEIQDRTFECVCPKLEAGRCSIYANRPKICAAYPAGGIECLLTVQRRRTPEQFDRIRDDADPKSFNDIGKHIQAMRNVALVRDPSASFIKSDD